MKSDTLFSEQQRFRQWWLWILLAAINGLFFYGLASQAFFGRIFGTRPMSDFGLLMATTVLAGLTILFLVMRLDTLIKNDGIYYRFYPFQLSFKQIPWSELKKAFVRKYNGLTEYGGWGLRIGLFGKGKAFTISGDKGMQLVYGNGDKFLLGSQKPEELENVLRKLGCLIPE